MSSRSLRREWLAFATILGLALLATLLVAHGCAADRAEALEKAASARSR
jgi:hypothetical protein